MFEQCILDRYGEFFITSNNQFGFKKQSGCSHAEYTLRRVVDYYVSFSTTINICALDISKAFDKMNHHCLFVNSFAAEGDYSRPPGLTPLATKVDKVLSLP